MSSNADRTTDPDSGRPPRERGFTFQNIHWLWLSVFVLLVDQVSKRLIINHFDLFDRLPLLGVLNITRMHNTGAAFSILTGAPPWSFAVLAIAVAIGILVWLHLHPYGERLVAVSLSLILGGALGNAIDRVAHGYVIDFIDFHVGLWHYPAFNFADCAIVIGAILMALDILWPWRRGDRA